MKTKLFFLLLSMTSLSFAQVTPVLEFYKIYNGPGNGVDFINDSQTDNNYNIYLAGRSAGPDSSSDLSVLKYSKKGDLLLNIIYAAGWHRWDEANSIAVDKDENIFVIGSTSPYSSSSTYTLFRKYSASGSIVWDKDFQSDPNFNSQGQRVVLDTKGNIITGIETWQNYQTVSNITKFSAAGDSLWSIQIKDDTSSNSVGFLMPDTSGNIYASITKTYHGNSDVPWKFYYLYKINKDGNVIWHQEIKGDLPRKIMFDKNSNILVGTHGDGKIFKYDPDGVLLWSFELESLFTDMKVDGNNNILVSGYFGYLTTKITSEGKVVWRSQFNSPEDLRDYATCLCLDKDNNIYVTGSSNDMVNNGICYTIKYSPEGEMLWKHRFDDTTGMFEDPRNIYLDDSNNVFICGQIAHPASGWDIYFMKIKQKIGTLVNNDGNLPARFTLNQNYPNPFNPSTTISYSIPKQSYVEMKIFDMLGREVSALVSKEQSAGEYKVQFDATSLPSGMYVYSIVAGEFRSSKKLLLIK